MNLKENKILKVGVVLPIYNVEKTISAVFDSVAATLADGNLDIFVIDNNSNDKTISIVQTYLRANSKFAEHVTLIQHKCNYGYGCSVKAGFEYFSLKEVSHVMVIHGDHQVDPAWLIEKLLGAIKSKPDTDLVLASRFKPESSIDNYSILRRWGNYFFNVTTTFCSGYRMSDSGTAMILIRTDILNNVPFRNLSNSWQFHPQLNILLYGLPGIRIQEIPTDWADSDADSTVPLFCYGLILLEMLLGYWFKKNVLKKPPQEIFPLDAIPVDREFAVLFCSENPYFAGRPDLPGFF